MLVAVPVCYHEQAAPVLAVLVARLRDHFQRRTDGTRLADTLIHGDLQERRLAVRALGRFGPAAADAVPALIEALGDEKTWMRNDAAIALGKIGPAAEAAIPALTAIQDDDILGFDAKKALKEITGK